MFVLLFYVVVVVLDLGIELFSSGRGDLYYPSNELDPYLKDAAVSYIHSFCFTLKTYCSSMLFIWNIN